MYIRDIILKKKQKGSLTEDEIKFSIQNYFKGEITEAQMAALMTAMNIFRLNEKEIHWFINAMAETGEQFEFYRLSNKITDIHILGGMSDKVLIILLCILNSLGLPSAKVIDRELGIEDRIFSLTKNSLNTDIVKFKNDIQNFGIGLLKNNQNLAPIEEKLYKLRHEISCDNDMGLIATSIMSQKIALGFSNIFFEITYGANAYVKTLSDAKILARYLTSIGKKELRNVGCVVTPLNQPLGNTFGNLLELKEIYEFLSGKVNYELEETILTFGSNILAISNYSNNVNKNKKMIKEKLQNGDAIKSFEKLLNTCGADTELLKKDINIKNKIPVMSSENGYLEEIDVNELRKLSQYINAIRKTSLDNLDIGAGVVFNKKIGDTIKKGDILGFIYTNNDTKIENAVELAKNMFKITDKKMLNLSRIKFDINNV